MSKNFEDVKIDAARLFIATSWFCTSNLLQLVDFLKWLAQTIKQALLGYLTFYSYNSYNFLFIKMSSNTVHPKGMSPSCMRYVAVLLVFSLKLTHVKMKGPHKIDSTSIWFLIKVIFIP